jgi:uncharacterized protein with gpF-like domain
MVQDYRQNVESKVKGATMQQFFAQDASPTSEMTETLTKLEIKWKRIFSGFAKKVSKDFVARVDESVNASVWSSLKVAGVEAPTMAYNKNVEHTLAAAYDFNHTLVTGIQQDVHEKIYESVMLSLTSPDPAAQGISGIENALNEIGGFSRERVKLIAGDQNSKLYASLSDERLIQNGVEEFDWVHSSAGKVPRQSHVEKDGKRFKVNDPRLWEGKKADQGPPGWAIHCRCRKRPVI